MIKKILIANRGEIAIRIIRTCKLMGIKTVAIYSNKDKDSLHVFMADECVCTEMENSEDGYTNINNIIQAALNTNCDAIHPGYGFYSEDYNFARKVEESGLIWVGPNSETMKKVENKYVVKKEAEKLGIPVIKNFNINDIKEDDFPVLLKSVNGAGGIGIKKETSIDSLKANYENVKDQVEKSLNNSELYIEKYIEGYRHIEIQFAVDESGKIIIFPERDCSIQKNYKKIIECTPSNVFSKELINKLKKDTEKIVKHFKYTNIGTVEFIIDHENNYYFLEINPRIQVEHTVTEMLTGVDLVELQINIADKKAVKDISINNREQNNYALEVRVNAISCDKVINYYNFPAGSDIRIETNIYNGMKVYSNYDGLLMKIICVGKTREKAILRMRQALEELIIEGIDTNIEELYDIITNEKFIKGEYNLEFLKDK